MLVRAAFNDACAFQVIVKNSEFASENTVKIIVHGSPSLSRPLSPKKANNPRKCKTFQERKRYKAGIILFPQIYFYLGASG
jgi:hypothetical protein